MLMRPHDFTALPPQPTRGHSHAHGGNGDGWVVPPMHPQVPSMIPGLETLRPRVTPFRAGRGVDPSTLPTARPRQVIALKDGDTLALEATMVRRSVAGRSFVAYGFNGQWPGPLIRVDRASTITVGFTNRIDMPTAVHWHGIRLDNRFDGVPHVTQEAVPPGGSFRYVVHFPDAGIYWYHSHHREDVQQDLGLYGNLLVRSSDPSFFAPAHREEVLMLDDFLAGERPELLRARPPRGGPDARRLPRRRGRRGDSLRSGSDDARAHGSLRQRLPRQWRAVVRADGE